MDRYFKLFDPSFIGYDRESIYKLARHYTENNQWDDVYPGVRVDNKRYSEDFLTTDAKKIIDAFHPDLGVTYKNGQLLRMDGVMDTPLHRDTDRLCAVLFPITPGNREFAPIRFFDDDIMEFASVNYSKQAIILNVLEYHKIDNKGPERINFQIDLHIPYRDVLELHRSGKLFRSFE